MNPDLAWAVWAGERARRIEPFLEHALPARRAVGGVAHARHALRGAGRRQALRPLLAYAAGELERRRSRRRRRRGAAVELIHAYSLVHDDLPCMDDDALRRGQPTCHVAFGEATALLAGDALQALAFDVLAATGLPMLARRARCSPKAAGRRGMAGGQAIDLASRRRDARAVAELETMHRMKTGALIRAAVRLGAACGRSRAGGGRRRSTPMRARPGSPSRSSTTCSTSRARRLRSARPPARTRRRASRRSSRCSALAGGQGKRGGAARRGACAHSRRSGRRRAGSPSSPTGSCCATADADLSSARARSTIPPRCAGSTATQLPAPRARAARVRARRRVAQTGGHLSSNLGTVELAIALHYVFDTPRDRIVWDVGHQTYAHKILTGRRARMDRLRHGGRALGLPATRRERLRHVRHCAFVDVDLGRARHGDRAQAHGRGPRASSP